MQKNYVLHSTQESRDNGTISILGIAETIFFVALTWFVAYYYDTYLHIYTAIAIAPFLLLKTPKSVDKAIEWFLYEHDFAEKIYYKDKVFWILIAIVACITGFINYFFLTRILMTYEGLNQFILNIFLLLILAGVSGIMISYPLLKIVLGGMATAIAVVAGTTIAVGAESGVVVSVSLLSLGVVEKIKNSFFRNLIYILISPSLLFSGAIIGLAFFLKSIITKFIITSFYTILNPVDTFFEISKNWQEQIAINDIFYSPELLPLLYKRRSTFQVSTLLNFDNDYMFSLIKLSIIPIWSLGYLYRFSIKSTAWFFFPLAYLANPNALQDKEKKTKAIKTQTWKKLFWFNLMISAILFLYFKFTGHYLDLLGLSKIQLAFIAEKMTQLREYFVPQAMWLLVVAVVLYFIMNIIISWQEHIKSESYNTLIYWLIKLIFILWMIFLAWHLVVFTNRFVLPELSMIFEVFFSKLDA